MTIRLLELPVAAVSVDEARSPDRDDSHIFEHLLHYCSKFEPLPAITIAIEGSTARVLRGHKYLLAARALGRTAIRAVVAGAPTSEELTSFLGETHAKVLDWEAIKTNEQRESVPMGWHVFFFARPLSPEEKAAFDAVVIELFSDPAIAVAHDDARPLAEFEAKTPATDAAWAARHLNAFTLFGRDHVAIVSYQGRRFAGAATGESVAP